MTVKAELDIDLICDDCGSSLDGELTRRGEYAIRPCEKCLERSAEEARASV